MRIYLTDRLSVEDGDRVLDESDLPGRQGRQVLTRLVAERSRPVPRDDLAELLWGDALPDRWEKSLAAVVSKLRSALGRAGLEASIRSAFGCYQLHLPAGAWVDLEAVEREVEAAEAHLGEGRAAEAAGAATVAAGLARRTLWPGEGGRWVEDKRAELRSLLVRALDALAEARIAAGDPGAAVAPAEETVGLEPFREAGYVRLMRAYAEAGDRGEALRAYERCRATLADELGVDPSPRTRAVHAEILGAGAGAEAPRVRHDLPAPTTSFVGREREMDEIAALLRTDRLLTLIGPGGVGKTRLALEVARAHPEEARLVQLEGIADPALVPAAMAAVLGVPEGRLEEASDRDVLLVWDTCERVLGACRELAVRLLAAGRGLRLLCTSREPLGAPGERTWTVPPLAIPSRPPLPEELSDWEATRLFCARARLRRPDFDPDPEEAAAVGEICLRLDGLPLAIELAAPWVRALSCAEIATRLDDRFRLLASSEPSGITRHATLRALVDWSHERLSPDERLLFARLSVFAGAFTLEAAEAVCADGGIEPDAVLHLIGALIDRSLLRMEPETSPTRYRMLDSVRAYAQERLEEPEEMGARHLRWCHGRAAWFEQEMTGGDQRLALDALEGDQDDIRRALGWALEREHPAAAQICDAVWRYWDVRGQQAEGRRWLERVLASAEVTGEQRVRLHAWAGWLAQGSGDLVGAERAYHAAVEGARTHGDAEGEARGLRLLGTLSRARGRLPEARTWLEEALDIYRRLGRDGPTAQVLQALGIVEQLEGRMDVADQRYTEALDGFLRSGDRRGQAAVTDCLANVAAHRGDPDRATTLLEESLAVRRELGDRTGELVGLSNLAQHLHRTGEVTRSEAMYAEAFRIDTELGGTDHTPALLLNLAGAAEARGAQTEARERYGEALARSEALGRAATAALALRGLGRVERAAGEPGRAVELSEQAVARTRELGRGAELPGALHDLAIALLDAGEDARAEALLREAIDLLGEDDPTETATLRETLLRVRGPGGT